MMTNTKKGGILVDVVAFLIVMALCLAMGTAKDFSTNTVSAPGVQTVMAAPAE